MARDAYKSEKRRKELERQKKLAEKREKRLHREERSEAEVLADLFGMPYQADGAEAGKVQGADPEGADAAASSPAEPSAEPKGSSDPESADAASPEPSGKPEDPSDPSNPA
jgi:hypothetical protein